jgi:hypothetical protein
MRVVTMFERGDYAVKPAAAAGQHGRGHYQHD